MKQIIPLILAASLLFASCAEMQVQKGRKGQVGAGAGAAVGAIVGQAIGHDTEATLIGAAAGGLLGYILGNEMDKYDREQINHVFERGVSGTPSAWVNPDTGNQFRVTPKPAYTDPQRHTICREAEIVAVVNGKPETTYTTACREPSGRWVLQK